MTRHPTDRIIAAGFVAFLFAIGCTPVFDDKPEPPPARPPRAGDLLHDHENSVLVSSPTLTDGARVYALLTGLRGELIRGRHPAVADCTARTLTLLKSGDALTGPAADQIIAALCPRAETTETT